MKSVISREKKTALNWVEANVKRIADMSDTIFRYAEPALREYKSSKLISDFLEENDFQVDTNIAGLPTAFLATYGSGKPVIATYGEYDARRGLSQKAVPYKEPVIPYGPGFTDAHNMLGVAPAGAFVATKVAMEEHDLKGTLKYFGTPAEKLLLGKPYMARDGYFEGLDAVLGFHPGNYAACRTTTVLWDNWPNAYKMVAYNFHALESRLGYPNPNALDAAILMATMVSSIGMRVGKVIMYGGLRDYSQIIFMWSRPTLYEINVVSEMLERCAKAAASAINCRLATRLITHQRTGQPNHVMAELVYRNLLLVGPPRYSEEEKEFGREIQRNLGVEPMEEPYIETITPVQEADTIYTGVIPDDSAELTWHAPMARLYVAKDLKPVSGINYPRTLARWVPSALCGMGVTHKMGVVAAKTLALSALELLTTPSELLRAKEEYEARIQEYKEEPLIPPGIKPPIELKWSSLNYIQETSPSIARN